MTQDDYLRTHIEFTGQDQARSAESAVRAFLATVTASPKSLGAMDVALAANAQQYARTAAAIGAANQQIGGGFGMSAYKLQVFAQGLDDLQYVGQMGLQPILNNVVQLSPAIGVALIAGNLLYKNWDSIAALWRKGETLSEADRMEALEHATHKTAEQTRQLKEYKEQIAELDKLNALKSDETRDRGAAVQKAIGEAGPGAAQAAVAKGLYDEAQAKIRELTGRVADFGARQARGEPITAAEVDERNRQQAEAADLARRSQAGPAGFHRAATHVLAEAGAGDIEAFRRVQRFGERRPEDFGPGLLQDIQAAGPEQRALEEQGRQRERVLAAQAAARKEEDRRRQETIRDLEPVGPGARDADQARARERREAEQAREQAGREAEQARRAEVAHAAAAFGAPAREDAVRGLAAGDAEATVRGRITRALEATGRVAPAAVAEAAGKILEDARDQLARRLAALGETGAADPAAALLEEARRKDVADRRALIRRREQQDEAQQDEARAVQLHEATGLSPDRARAAAKRARDLMEKDFVGEIEALERAAREELHAHGKALGLRSVVPAEVAPAVAPPAAPAPIAPAPAVRAEVPPAPAVVAQAVAPAVAPAVNPAAGPPAPLTDEAILARAAARPKPPASPPGGAPRPADFWADLGHQLPDGSPAPFGPARANFDRRKVRFGPAKAKYARPRARRKVIRDRENWAGRPAPAAPDLAAMSPRQRAAIEGARAFAEGDAPNRGMRAFGGAGPADPVRAAGPRAAPGPPEQGLQLEAATLKLAEGVMSDQFKAAAERRQLMARVELLEGARRRQANTNFRQAPMGF
jgi:hypothetical protein